MKKISYVFVYIIILITIIISEYDYLYDPETVIYYINEQKLEKDELITIVDYLKNIFNDAYAFNEISIYPPQPPFQNNYHNTVDIFISLNELKNKINNNVIIEVYDFYREINLIFSQLKDSHIQLSWNLLELQEFFIIAPVEFYLKEINNEPKIFVTCLEDEFQDKNDDNDLNNALNTCSDNEDKPVKLINNLDPFDFINNFGGNFLSTKNEHATFSFKLKNHNNLPLSDYPLSLNELNELNIEFESGEHIDTKYFIGSESIEIDNDEGERLRNLNKKNINNNLRTKINRKRKSKRNLDNNNIIWNYETKGEDEDLFKCFEDETNKINIYYITSFNPIKKDRYIEVIKYCYELFDKNDYPIIVINDLNEGGLISLSQLFLGIISPLMSINLYKGRMRITDTFKDTPDIKYYIETNLTSSENCLHTNYERLTNERVNVKYDNNIEIDLTQIFFLTNISLHNEIENIRKEMINKRKPTDILVFTDGYTFSAGSLFMQYLQKNGGAIIASYIGNPKYKTNKIFDISQSPSPLFNSKLLKIFSPENYLKLNEESYSKDDNNWEIQFPGIQSFYDSDDYKNPLEYEVIRPDINSDIYENLNEGNYIRFIKKSKEIFDKFKEECNPDNKNLIKVSEDCDNKFGNKYTHGGYECGGDGKWNKSICVPSYCDPGYFFNQKKKKCVKDICSSIPVKINENDIDSTDQINLDHNYFGVNIINIIILFIYFFI